MAVQNAPPSEATDDYLRLVITGYMLITIRGLLGSTPQDRGGASTRLRISLWLQRSLFVLPTAAILFSEGLEGPAWQDWELRHRAAAKTRLEQRPMTEGPRRNAS